MVSTQFNTSVQNSIHKPISGSKEKTEIKREKQGLIKVATRTSPLALLQVKEVFSFFPGLKYTLVPVESYGDKHKEISLINNVIPDIFTRELDHSLLSQLADIAIHSAKDLPYPLPKGLEVIALTKAFDQTDALVSKNNLTLKNLPSNPKIGTSSLIRKAELLKIRPDIQIVSIRGTIDERIKQVDDGTLDAVIIATCALKRLFLHNRITEILPFETHPLQGNLAIVAKTSNRKFASLFSKIDVRKKYGKVSLVGFGPGDPELLTRKGYSLIKHADVILYDDLINHDFLNQFKATKVYVGKRSKNHSMEQDAINRLLYNYAIEGQNVVRLKGGDPMIFGHGGEETEYLKQNFVDVAVIPGITSALAASAITQIPLTHRDITNAVTFVSGHDPNKINFSGNSTFAVYMGASNAKAIAQRAIEQGRKPTTPVLLISNVSNPNQETETTDLASLSTTNFNLKTPLLMIIGDVVDTNKKSEPSIHPVIWVTGTSADYLNGPFKILHNPLIQIAPLHDYSVLQTILKKLDEFNWIIFTSRHTVTYFFEQLFLAGKDVRSLAGNKIASVGKTTSQELLLYGIVPDIQPHDESSDGLVKEFKKMEITNKNILIPRSNLALPVLPEGLTDYGNKITTTVVYENRKPEHISIPQPDDYDAVLFSSPSCVDNFVQLGQSFLPSKKYIVQGNQTFFKLISAGIKPSQVYSKEEFETSMFYI